MKFHQPNSEIFVPDGIPLPGALERTTHLGVAAHPDDLEIMAASAILECFQNTEKWFTGAVVTDGRGSPRQGPYRDFTDEEMLAFRRKEQRKAAVVGEYAAQILLDYPSSAVADPADRAPVDDLAALVKACRPQILYTHNLADKHDTHVGVALAVIAAVRSLPAEFRPQKVFGCEVWRSLDWLADSDKIAFDCSPRASLQAALLGVYDSQIAGGKRYDLATLGRRQANATYYAPLEVDSASGLTFGMDLTPLIADPLMDVPTYVEGFIRRFAEDVADRFRRLGVK